MGDQLQGKPDGRQKRDREEATALWQLTPVYIPFKKQKGDDFARVRRHLIKKFSRNEVKTLQVELEAGGFSKDYIAKFFEEEHHAILHWLLIGSENTSSFQFILDTFTPEAIKNKLRKDNFSFLADVLDGRSIMERLGVLSPQNRMLDCERLKLLLQIDPDGMQEFMERNRAASFMKPSTWEDYEMALQSYNATKRHGVIPPTP